MLEIAEPAFSYRLNGSAAQELRSHPLTNLSKKHGICHRQERSRRSQRVNARNTDCGNGSRANASASHYKVLKKLNRRMSGKTQTFNIDRRCLWRSRRLES